MKLIRKKFSKEEKPVTVFMPRVVDGKVQHAQHVDIRELTDEQLNNLVKNPSRKKNKKLARNNKIGLTITSTTAGAGLGGLLAKNHPELGYPIGAAVGGLTGYGAAKLLESQGDKFLRRNAEKAQKELDRRKKEKRFSKYEKLSNEQLEDIIENSKKDKKYYVPISTATGALSGLGFAKGARPATKALFTSLGTLGGYIAGKDWTKSEKARRIREAQKARKEMKKRK